MGLMNKVIAIGSNSFPNNVQSEVDRKIAAIKASMRPIPMDIGGKHDFPRTGQRYDNKKHWPDIKYIRPEFINAFCKTLSPADATFVKNLNFYLFKTLIKGDNVIDGVFDDMNSDVYIPMNLQWFFINGDHGFSELKDRQLLMEQHILYIFSQSTNQELSKKAITFQKNDFFHSTEINNLEQQAKQLVQNIQKGEDDQNLAPFDRRRYIEGKIELEIINQYQQSKDLTQISLLSADSDIPEDYMSHDDIDKLIKLKISALTQKIMHDLINRKSDIQQEVDLLGKKDILLDHDDQKQIWEKRLTTLKFKFRSIITKTMIVMQGVMPFVKESSSALDQAKQLVSKIKDKKTSSIHEAYTIQRDRFNQDTRDRYAKKKPLRYSMASLNVHSGDFRLNTKLILKSAYEAKQAKSHRVIFQETALSAYHVGDNAARDLPQQMEALREINKEVTKFFSKDVIAWLTKNTGKDVVDAFKERMDKIDEDMFKKQITDTFVPDKLTAQTKQDLKQYKLSEALREILQNNSKYNSDQIIEDFNKDYDDHGLGLTLPAFMPSGKTKPFNGTYVFRMDGSLALEVGKQELISEYYFNEPRFQTFGRRDILNSFVERGHIVGHTICEDFWQELLSKLQQKMVLFGSKLTIQDPNMADYLDQGMDVHVNGSASPENAGNLKYYGPAMNMDKLPKDGYILNGALYRFMGKRSDTRLDLIKATPTLFGVNELYTNTLGNNTNITMAGGAYAVIPEGKDGKVVGSLPQYTEGIGVFDIDKDGTISVPVEPIGYQQEGDATFHAGKEIREALVLALKDILLKNDADGVSLRADGSIGATLFLKLFLDANRMRLIEMMNRFLLNTGKEFNSLSKKERMKILKDYKIKLDLHLQPLDPRSYVKEIVQAYRGKKYYEARVRLNMPLINDMPWALPISVIFSYGSKEVGALLHQLSESISKTMLNNEVFGILPSDYLDFASDIMKDPIFGKFGALLTGTIGIMFLVNSLIKHYADNFLNRLAPTSDRLAKELLNYSESRPEVELPFIHLPQALDNPNKWHVWSKSWNAWNKRKVDWAKRMPKELIRTTEAIRAVSMSMNNRFSQWGNKNYIPFTTHAEETILPGNFDKAISGHKALFKTINSAMIRVIWLDSLEEQMTQATDPVKFKSLYKEWLDHTKEMTEYGLSREQKKSIAPHIALQRKLSINRILGTKGLQVFGKDILKKDLEAMNIILKAPILSLEYLRLH